jgi:hypothetical protein
MRLRRLYGFTLFLAISVSVISACVSVLLMAGEYHSARLNLNAHDREYQGWQACRQTNPVYFESNAEAVNACLSSLESARDNFWLRCSKAEVAGLFIVAGLGSAAGGYLAIWGLVGLIGIGYHRLSRWISLRSPPKSRARLEDQSDLHPDSAEEHRSTRLPKVETKPECAMFSGLESKGFGDSYAR